MNQRLSSANKLFCSWCDENNVDFDVVADEDDLQGFLVPRAHALLMPRLASFMSRVADRHGVHVREHRTRAGTVFAMSLTALSESAVEDLLPSSHLGRLARRLDLVYDGVAVEPPQAAESQYNPPSSANRRQYVRPTASFSGRLNRRLREDAGYLSVHAVVSEALDGIAAHHQPMEVLKQFEAALRDLGLLDGLKAAQVTNRLSRDKQVIHFYVPDGDREREVAGYELTKLAEGNEMENAIKDLIDIARRRAPGTISREAQKVKDTETGIRNVAKKYSMEKQGQQGQQQVPLMPGTVGAGDVPVEGTGLSRGLDALLS